MAQIDHDFGALLAALKRHTLHSSRVLSTSDGIEASLCTLYYGLRLLHSRLAHLLEVSYERMADEIVARASKTMMPGEIVGANIEPPHVKLRDHCERARGAGATIYKLRCFLRLWGLVRIYDSARATHNRPPHDPIIKLLAWSQIGAKSTYQILENGAFLANIGLFRSKDWRARAPKWWAWSNRAYMISVVLNLLRLLRVRQLQYNEEFGAQGKAAEEHLNVESKVNVNSEELKKRWVGDLCATVGWIAPTLYLSYEDPLESPVSESWMGISGIVPGIIALQDVWVRTK
jgi:hypothetical protein